MNKVFLIGNLTRDPESSETRDGVSVCRFTIAVTRAYLIGGERETDFFNCTAWRGLADSIARYVRKGSKVAVSGSIQIRNYEDNQGNRRTAVDVIAQDVEFLTSPKDKNRTDSEDAEKRHAPDRQARQLSAFDDDGDLPF